jgi:hypothetical protein
MMRLVVQRSSSWRFGDGPLIWDTVFTGVLSLLLVHAGFRRNRRPLREVRAEIVTEGESFAPDLRESESHIVSRPAAVEAESHLPHLADVAKYESPLDEPAELVPLDEPAELVDAEPEIRSAEPSVSPTVDAPVDHRPDEPAPPALFAPSISIDEWTCEIALWHGDSNAIFYARTYWQGEELTIAESQPFGFRGQDDPEETKEIRRAHHRLGKQLVRAGWEPSGSGGPWYNHRFRRDFTVAGLIASLTTPATSARRDSNTA